MLLSNKTILITGASRGIGAAMARTFAQNGAETLILLARDVEKLESLKNELSSTSTKVLCFSADVTKKETIAEVFKSLNADKIFIDVLVNNAGVMKDAVLSMVKDELIHDIYETNVFGVFHVSQFAIKSMMRKRGGSIINLSSIIGTNGNLGQTIYGSSKSAIIGFTKSLSKELASLQIRVNAIAPGFIDTDMTKSMSEEFFQKNLASIAMKRIGQPEDVAKVALFLASDLSGYVTGQIIGVDGGMVI